MSAPKTDNKVEHEANRPLDREGKHTPETPLSESQQKEIGGRKGPDPTRYGDWEKNGRCIDF